MIDHELRATDGMIAFAAKGDQSMMPAPKFPQYKTVPTASLIPYVRNARTHSPQQVDKIAASIREFGFDSHLKFG